MYFYRQTFLQLQTAVLHCRLRRTYRGLLDWLLGHSYFKMIEHYSNIRLYFQDNFLYCCTLMVKAFIEILHLTQQRGFELTPSQYHGHRSRWQRRTCTCDIGKIIIWRGNMLSESKDVTSLIGVTQTHLWFEPVVSMEKKKKHKTTYDSLSTKKHFSPGNYSETFFL